MPSATPFPAPRSAPLSEPRSHSDESPPLTDRAGPIADLVRRATSADVRATSQLHVEHLPVGLFPSLGARFVARWHRAHIDSGNGVALVSYDPAADGVVTGFLVGSVDRAAFRVDLLTRHRRELLLHGSGALIVRPRVLARFMRTRSSAYLRRLRRSGTRDRVPGQAVADLTAIAVVPQRHRRGAGRALTEEFLRICVHAGAAHAELVADNAASGFYERIGWESGRSASTRDGRSLRWFSIDLHHGRTGQ